jgi:ABC-type multidrug transport system ATPase subunit
MIGLSAWCANKGSSKEIKGHPQGSIKLIISNISKTFPGNIQALRNVSLNIPYGMYGLLGPNGAGKSTLMSILATLQQPDEGSLSFGNINILSHKDEMRQALGYLPHEFGLYPNITAEELLDYFAILKGIAVRRARKEITELLLRRTNLWDVRRLKPGCYSPGMRKRLALAVALLGNPKLIIADDPTTGLDPGERMQILNLLSGLSENRVVILSTQTVEDVAELCTNMAIIHKGRVLLEAQPMQAVEELQGKIWRRMIDKRALGGLMKNHAVISTRLLGERAAVHVYSEEDPGSRFEPVPASLEDVYFSTISVQYRAAAMQQTEEVIS